MPIQILKTLLNSSYYRALDSETKAKAMKKIADVCYDMAKYKVLGVKGSSKISKFYAYASATSTLGSDVSLMYYLSSNCSTKSEVLKYLNTVSGMSKAKKLLICAFMEYQISSENETLVSNYLKSCGLTSSQIKEFL